jgi:hypothetical protein
MCGIEANTAVPVVNGTTASPTTRPSQIPVKNPSHLLYASSVTQLNFK